MNDKEIQQNDELEGKKLLSILNDEEILSLEVENALFKHERSIDNKASTHNQDRDRKSSNRQSKDGRKTPNLSKEVKQALENILKNKSKIDHPVDVDGKLHKAPKDVDMMTYILNCSVLDIVTTKGDDNETSRMIATGCYKLFSDEFFRNLFGWKIPRSRNTYREVKKHQQRIEKMILVWDFNEESWKYINLDNLRIAGVSRLYDDVGNPMIENILRLVLWYVITHKGQTTIRKQRFKEMK